MNLVPQERLEELLNRSKEFEDRKEFPVDGVPCHEICMMIREILAIRWMIARCGRDVEQIMMILLQFAEARLHGQQKYGGTNNPESYEDARHHDLDHELKDWLEYAADHMKRASLSGSLTMDCRDHLVKAGGLILSAVWTEDIRSSREKLTPKES